MTTTTSTTSDLSITTTEHPNATRMRDAFEAFGRGDLDAVLENMTDDCTWFNEGASPLAGAHQGKEAIAQMFLQLFTLSDGTFTTEPITILADDARSLAVYDGTATIGGDTKTLRWVLCDEMTSDGKVAECHCFCYDQAAADAHLMSGSS